MADLTPVTCHVSILNRATDPCTQRPAGRVLRGAHREPRTQRDMEWVRLHQIGRTWRGEPARPSVRHRRPLPRSR
jgi:hypothetical protein